VRCSELTAGACAMDRRNCTREILDGTLIGDPNMRFCKTQVLLSVKGDG